MCPASAGLAESISAQLRGAVEARVFPGAVAAIAFGERRYLIAAGRETYDHDAPEVSRHALFDVASLTKVVATTTAIMQLIESQALSLDDRAVRYLPRLDHSGKREITIRQLMTHTAGYPGPYEFFRFCHTPEQLIDAIYAVDLVDTPGARRLYDDISFMLLAFIVEEIVGTRFDRHCGKTIFEPLNMSSTTYCPSVGDRQVIPTEIDPQRGGLLRGVVHDENCSVLGGVAGHAGLFSTGEDLLRFAAAIVGSLGPVAHDSAARVLSAQSVARMCQREWRDHEGEYGLGWDRGRPHYMGSPGDEEVIGHTGFTGTSMVIMPRRALVIILLSNRIHPQRSDPAAIHAVRRELVQTALRWSEQA
jgi:CubicO group peptidase (beta-lactamase class C family)